MNPLLKRRTLLINGTLGVLLIAGGGLSYAALGASDATGAGSVRTGRVTRATVVSSVSASGSIASSTTRALSFDASGTIKSIKVAVGAKVKKGQVLATVDDTSAKEQVRVARANLDAAEAGDTSTAQGYSSYLSALNAYKDAKRTLAGTVLKAPFGGTVIAVNGTVGGSSSGASGQTGASTGQNGASSGQTATSSSTGSSGSSGVVQLADTGKLEVTGSFTESDVTKLKVGQAASVSFDALPGTTAQGKVTQISPQPTTSNNVVQYTATVTLTEIPENVRLGQTVTVQVVVASAENVLVVPTAAVRTLGGQSIVTVLQNGQQVPTRVQIGIAGDSGTEITSGLTEGQQVVLVVAANATAGTGFPGGGGVFVGGGGALPGGGGGPR